ncbi:hypothetical protein CC1G_00085 [Coprinopsis cinerea okayama7|uniref:Uncharacterized protein n=1 Tax=Coprinopsis cinerea (strain Okayama-7 / 130 / ATCC MYA-4618 / FGSC 9003) TaxID=240176 RepID=A8NWP5_COPC7|nr:hypothetical protein CC1G_00085 [Coprinopsis cinerea okayama7\|eukprot:XP_001836949.2 hypothetical protein CC1G_00085 [Coprinopsis cinerea okayama7\
MSIHPPSLLNNSSSNDLDASFNGDESSSTGPPLKRQRRSLTSVKNDSYISEDNDNEISRPWEAYMHVFHQDPLVDQDLQMRLARRGIKDASKALENANYNNYEGAEAPRSLFSLVDSLAAQPALHRLAISYETHDARDLLTPRQINTVTQNQSSCTRHGHEHPSCEQPRLMAPKTTATLHTSVDWNNDHEHDVENIPPGHTDCMRVSSTGEVTMDDQRATEGDSSNKIALRSSSRLKLKRTHSRVEGTFNAKD